MRQNPVRHVVTRFWAAEECCEHGWLHGTIASTLPLAMASFSACCKLGWKLQGGSDPASVKQVDLDDA